MLKWLPEPCKIQVYGRFKVKAAAHLIHCYVNTTEENHKEQIQNMRLNMILLSTLPIYMCFILGFFLQNAKNGYPSNCHMLLSLFLRYRAAYKRIILCTFIRISQHHRESGAKCHNMYTSTLKVLRRHVKETAVVYILLVSICNLIFLIALCVNEKQRLRVVWRKMYTWSNLSVVSCILFIRVLVDSYTKQVKLTELL